jgi:hypothetical protein
MRAGSRSLSLALALTCASVSCGTVTVTSNDPTARLYAEGRLLGQGTGRMQRRGMFGSTTVTAVSANGQRVQTHVSREFTAFTLLTGFLTYGVCFLACWEYPEVVLVEFRAPDGLYSPARAGYPAGASASSAADPWLMPPAGWQPHSEGASPAPPPEVGPTPSSSPAAVSSPPR